MGKLLVVLLALLAPLPAYAGSNTFQDQDGNSWDVPTPPLRYFTMTYPGYLEVIPKPAQDTLEICTRATGKNEPHGCVYVFSNRCTIYVSDGLPILFRNAVLQHERAHCNGWGADHPED